MSKTTSSIQTYDIQFEEGGKIYEKNNQLIYDTGVINVIHLSNTFYIKFNPKKYLVDVLLMKDINKSIITSNNMLDPGNVVINENGINIDSGEYQVYGSISFRAKGSGDVLLSLLDMLDGTLTNISSMCGKTVKEGEIVTLQTMGVAPHSSHTISMILRASKDINIQIVDFNIIFTRL
jgi:hypothetical protein